LFEWECTDECMILYFSFFLLVWMRVHGWMHDTLFFIFTMFEWECIYECMILLFYFLWEIKIPLLEQRTSIPKKYFSPPKSFISNSLNKLFLSCAISSISLSVMIMSSTYIIRYVIKSPFLFKNKVWSELLCLYSYLFMATVNLPNQARGDYLSP